MHYHMHHREKCSSSLLKKSSKGPLADVRGSDTVYNNCEADLTCLPKSVVEKLGLIEMDEVKVAPYDSPPQVCREA